MALNAVAKKWVAALRSGKYQQGKCFLKTDDGKFCCLGVLAELAKEVGLSNDGDKFLDGSVVIWSGLHGSSGSYANGESLAFDNDRGKTFLEIADIIESEPEGLFSLNMMFSQ
jgi:hypothetical protein